MKKCGVTWFIWVRADTGKTKSPYLLTETEAQVNSHILWFVSHTGISWGRIWTWSFIGVQTYTNLSYKLKESENRSQTTDRNEGSPKRKSLLSEARNWVCHKSKHPMQGLELQEQRVLVPSSWKLSVTQDMVSLAWDLCHPKSGQPRGRCFLAGWKDSLAPNIRSRGN